MLLSRKPNQCYEVPTSLREDCQESAEVVNASASMSSERPNHSTRVSGRDDVIRDILGNGATAPTTAFSPMVTPFRTVQHSHPTRRSLDMNRFCGAAPRIARMPVAVRNQSIGTETNMVSILISRKQPITVPLNPQNSPVTSLALAWTERMHGRLMPIRFGVAAERKEQ